MPRSYPCTQSNRLFSGTCGWARLMTCGEQQVFLLETHDSFRLAITRLLLEVPNASSIYRRGVLILIPFGGFLCTSS